MKNKAPAVCETRDAMTHLAQERWTHDTQSVLQLRHYIWDCHVQCGEIMEECKNAVIYCLNKSWSNIQIK